MIAGHRDCGELAEKIQTFVGIGGVTDGIPQTEKLLDPFFFHRGKNRLERFQVTVNVGEESIAHNRPYLSKANFKSFKLPSRGLPLDFFFLDVNPHDIPDIVQKSVNSFFFPFKRYFHPSVGKIFNPSGQLQIQSNPLGGKAETNSLHLATVKNMRLFYHDDSEGLMKSPRSIMPEAPPEADMPLAKDQPSAEAAGYLPHIVIAGERSERSNFAFKTRLLRRPFGAPRNDNEVVTPWQATGKSKPLYKLKSIL